MFAQLGNIVFEGRFTPLSFSARQDPVYAEHELVNRKNKLQPTGLQLKEISFDMLLRSEWCDVKATLAALHTYRDNFTVMPLLWGYGEVEGNFLITGMNTGYLQQLSDASPVSVNVNIQLKEFAGDTLASSEKDMRDKAPAAGVRNQGTMQARPVSPSENTQTATTVSTTNSNAASLDDLVAQYSNQPLQNNSVLNRLNNILNEVNKIKQRVQDPLSNLYGNNTILNAAQNLSGTAFSMAGLIQDNINGGSNSVATINAVIQSNVLVFATSLATFVYRVIIRG